MASRQLSSLKTAPLAFYGSPKVRVTREEWQSSDRLKSLADDELLAPLANIVQQRNQITAEVLAYLAELDQRQIFLDLGFSSLFEYCVEALGLCESTAGRHRSGAGVSQSS